MVTPDLEKAPERNYIEDAKMRPRARIISLIGEELISDEPVAVVELVKNAYDADATYVNVIFESNGRSEPERLIIEDDGHGMDLDAVLGGWFEPGTIMKKQLGRSPSGRLYQGAKGIGRFAAARLGTELILETGSTKKKQSVIVILEWGLFDDDSYLDEVKISYEMLDKKPTKKGTKLTIEGVRDRKKWAEDDYDSLHQRLSRLISPFDEIGDFKINLDIPFYPELTGEVDSHEITKKPIYLFKGNITGEGVLNGEIQINEKVHKSFINEKLNGNNESVGCGGFSFEIRAWDRDREGLSPYMLKYNKNLRGVREILDNYCGVSIYRDGFRVHPYGEKGNDWLFLDNRSRQNPTRNLANNQVIASIKISRESNPEIKDRTTREGLVHNYEFESLNDWFKRILSKLEEERYLIRPREEAKPEYVNTLFEAFDLSDVLDEANKQLGKNHPVSLLVKDKDQGIREGVKKLQDHYSRVLLAAGLGQLVDLVIHEIGAPLGRINRELNHLASLLKEYEFEENDGKEINSSLLSIGGWLEQVANLRGRLDPKTAGKRGKATSFDVADEILGNLNLYENLIAKQGVKIRFNRPKEAIVVHMSRSNAGQIIANLIDNSIFWLTRHHGDGKGGVIEIKLRKIDNGFKIIYCDDGPGIRIEDKDRIFEQYYSSKPNGMGLGLYIARQIIEPYGKLLFRDDCSLPGACFEAVFERKVGV